MTALDLHPVSGQSPIRPDSPRPRLSFFSSELASEVGFEVRIVRWKRYAHDLPGLRILDPLEAGPFHPKCLLEQHLDHVRQGTLLGAGETFHFFV